jgi:uncharacterized protein YjiS (DUF1127 family)
MSTLSLHLPKIRQAQSPSLFARLIGRLNEPFVRLRVVNELENLSDHHLRDIGIARRDIATIAEREIARLRRY